MMIRGGGSSEGVHQDGGRVGSEGGAEVEICRPDCFIDLGLEG